MPHIAKVLSGKTGQRTGNSGQLGQLGNRSTEQITLKVAI
jgi:hypothetical protein